MSKLTTSCLLAILGVGLGAFGAHGLEPILERNGTVETWKTASQYHLLHALALFAVALAGERWRSQWTTRLWTLGIFLFSGSLYVLALTQWKILGPVTPFGGLAFIGGWLAMLLENRK